MPARLTPTKPVSRIRNSSQSNDALVRRGSLTLWVDQATRDAGRSQGPNQPGAHVESSDWAIPCRLTLRATSHLTRRASEGFACALFERRHRDRPVPASRTLGRRAATVRITRPRRASGPLPRILDSPGRKVDGADAGKVRQHGSSPRRTGRKLPRAIAPQTQEIAAAMVSTPGVTEAAVVASWLEPVENPIEGVGADGREDCRAVSEAGEGRGARAVIPPRREATIERPGHTAGPRLVGDENRRRIGRVGRSAWKEESGYHRRSLGATAMFPRKTLFGGGGSRRRMAQQATEVGLRCRALNLMTHQGRPQSKRVAA